MTILHLILSLIPVVLAGRDAKEHPDPRPDQWSTFVLPWDDTLSGPTNMSFLLHKPAGHEGFMNIRDGHLYTGEGSRWRIFGFNMVYSASLPLKSDAGKIAKRLAKFGVNCIRIHHLDNPWPDGILERNPGFVKCKQNHSTCSLDKEALDRFDFFIYQCIQNGIYIDLNLNVSRPFSLADGVVQADCLGHGSKSVTYFDPVLIKLQKEYATELLDHMNPYTGNKYAHEPAVAIIEILNENSLLENWVCGRLQGTQNDPTTELWIDIPEYYSHQLDALWNQWLINNYDCLEDLLNAWNADLGVNENPWKGSVARLTPDRFGRVGKRRFYDETLFYAELEKNFFHDMSAFLKNEIGARQIIMGCSDHNHHIYNIMHVKNNADLGIVDTHCYWDFPWQTNNQLRIENLSMIDFPDNSVISLLARSKVAGIPMIVSETNEPFPNDHRSEFIPIVSAYAGIQDWDGVFFYAYSDSEEAMKSQAVGNPGNNDQAVYELCDDPVMMAQFAVSALAFQKGFIKPANKVISQDLTGEWLLESYRHKPQDEYPFYDPYLKGRIALNSRIEIAVFNSKSISPSADGIEQQDGNLLISSDTKEVFWSMKKDNTYVAISTDYYEAFTGYKCIKSLEHLKINLASPFASVQLASLTKDPIRNSSKLLLVSGARVSNTGMKWTDDERKSIDAIGHGPTRIEPVIAEVGIEGLDAFREISIVALDEQGQPANKIEHEIDKKGHVVLHLDNSTKTTIWYLIQIVR